MKITRELIQRLQTNNKAWKYLSEEERDAFTAVYNGRSRKSSNIERVLGTGFRGRVTPVWHWEGVYRLVDTHQPRIEEMIKDSEQEETTKVKEKVMDKKTRTEVTWMTVYHENKKLFELSIVDEFVLVEDLSLNKAIYVGHDEWNELQSAINQLMSVIIARGEG